MLSMLADANSNKLASAARVILDLKVPFGFSHLRSGVTH